MNQNLILTDIDETELEEVGSDLFGKVVLALHKNSAMHVPVQNLHFDSIMYESESCRKQTISKLDQVASLFERSFHQIGSEKFDAMRRRKVAKVLCSTGNYLGDHVQECFDSFENSEFKRGKASDFPEIPGEDYQNSALSQV